LLRGDGLLETEDVVRDLRTAIALHAELADRLRVDALLDLSEGALAHLDLTGLGLASKACREVGHRADGAVVVAALEADAAERRVARRYPAAKPELVTALPSCRDLRFHAVADRDRHPHRAKGVIVDRRGVVDRVPRPAAAIAPQLSQHRIGVGHRRSMP